MLRYFFVSGIILGLYMLFRWAFQALPQERWQVIGVLPAEKTPDGFWNGINLTYYGFFTATAYLFATVLVYIFLGAMFISPLTTTILFFLICCASVPSARILARVIEKKPHTASIGAASFVGILIAPWAASLVMQAARLTNGAYTGVMATLAAMMIAYAFGEGVGRLACISFGCCYGRPLSEMPALLKRPGIFRPFIFTGATKKAAYADGLEGRETFPIQAVTAVLYCGSGVVGTFLFLGGSFTTAFLTSLVITQVWRFTSEFLRADYRGETRISVYQIMAVATVPYGIFIAWVFNDSAACIPDLLHGFALLYNPVLLLFLQFIWAAMFWHSGRSHTTGARLQFYINPDKI